MHRQWDARFGGTGYDPMASLVKANDGGFILAGYSGSPISGDKTQSCLFNTGDYWIVKSDGQGQYVWDRRFGGSNNDFLTAICATKDGGSLIGGSSASDSGYDKSESSRGGWDYWVVKVDRNGNKQWDKRYGGLGGDDLYCMKQTKDGGYVLGGRSSSGVSGDKTQDNHDASENSDDYWMVKIDSNGRKQWDKRFGTAGDEACTSILQTSDGGYLLGGLALGDTSFDKTQMNFHGQFTNPYNIWVVKTDSVGNKQWDRVYGTTDFVRFAGLISDHDGNVLIGGSTISGVSGNKTATQCGYWVVKIDLAGNKLGDWGFGTGYCAETLGSISGTSDGGCILSGISGPYKGDDKTEDNLGNIQVWSLKIDSQMHRVWDKTALTSFPNDIAAGATEVSLHCFAVGVSTPADIGGDKSQACRGDVDYWMVEYCDTVMTAVQEVAGDLQFSIYPNPATSDISVHLESSVLHSANFTLSDLSGRILYRSQDDGLASSYTKMIDIHTLPAGSYFLEVLTADQCITRVVVKE